MSKSCHRERQRISTANWKSPLSIFPVRMSTSTQCRHRIGIYSPSSLTTKDLTMLQRRYSAKRPYLRIQSRIWLIISCFHSKVPYRLVEQRKRATIILSRPMWSTFAFSQVSQTVYCKSKPLLVNASKRLTSPQNRWPWASPSRPTPLNRTDRRTRAPSYRRPRIRRRSFSPRKLCPLRLHLELSLVRVTIWWDRQRPLQPVL